MQWNSLENERLSWKCKYVPSHCTCLGRLCKGWPPLCMYGGACSDWGRICIYSLVDHCMGCHLEIEVADQTSCVSYSQCTDAGPTRRSTDSISTQDTWQGSRWDTKFEMTGMTRSWKMGLVSGSPAHSHPLP